MRLPMRENSTITGVLGSNPLAERDLMTHANRVTFREFCSLCLAEYSVQFPVMLATVAGLLLACTGLLLWLG